jgi:hypothetical protein
MATGSEAIRLPQLLILLHFISVATRLPIAGHVLTQLGRQRQEAQEEDPEGIPHAEANVAGMLVVMRSDQAVASVPTFRVHASSATDRQGRSVV